MSIVISTILLLLVVLVYRRHLRPQGNIGLFILRLMVIILFALVLSGQIINLTSKKRPNRVVLLLDRSLSMTAIGAESEAEKATEKIISSLPKWLKPELWVFGETAYVLADKEQKPPFPRTRLARALELSASTIPGALILLSDGQDNGEKAPVELLRKLNLPIYVIGFGEKQQCNLRLSDVETPMSVYTGDTVNIKVRLLALGFTVPEKVTLRAGENVKHVLLQGDFSEQEIEFPIVFSRPGRQQLEIKVESLAGELTYSDNQRNVVIDVKRAKTHLLYFTNRPGMGTRFILGALKKNRRFAVKELLAIGSGLKKTVPLVQADVVILDGIAESDVDDPFWQELSHRVETGLGLFVIAGPDFKSGQELTRLLPIKDLQMKNGAFTPQANSQEILSEWLATDNIDLNIIPPFSGVFSGRLRDEKAVIWLEAIEDRTPLLVGSRIKKGKVVFLGAYPIWRWGFISDFPLEKKTPLEIILDKVLRYLCEDDTLQFHLETAALIYPTGEPVRLTFSARMPDGNPWQGLDVSLNIDSRNSPIPLTEKDQGRYYVDIQGVLPGEHIAIAEAKLNDRVIGRAKVQFTVSEQSIELLHLGLNRALLSRIAAMSGGWFVPLESLPATLINQIQTKVYERQLLLDPRRLPWCYGLLVALFGVELVLRRLKGLY